MPPPAEITVDHLAAVDLRVGTIVAVEPFPEARRPAWKLTVDLGPELGARRSSAQITHYPADDLLGRQVVVVANLPPRQVGPVRSEVLVLGALDPRHGVVLLRPDAPVEDGSRIA
ncbi:MAG: tRNA-binding protein [Solirubrobacteraceae bacterium]|nr:tRNA-binding protein [Solirubrobacteraceae bacterium]